MREEMKAVAREEKSAPKDAGDCRLSRYFRAQYFRSLEHEKHRQICDRKGVGPARTGQSQVCSSIYVKQ